MKERLFKVIKIILMIFGILFLLQILFFCLVVIGVKTFNPIKPFKLNFDIDKIQTTEKPKEIMPIIEYVEDYQLKNRKYPEKIENINIKNKLDYTYETTKDGNCYTITVKNKNQQYQHCKLSSDSSSSTSESWVEYSN